MRVSCDTRELGLLGPLLPKLRVMMRAMFDTRELRYTRATIGRLPPPPNMRAMMHAKCDTREPQLPGPLLHKMRAMMPGNRHARELRRTRARTAWTPPS